MFTPLLLAIGLAGVVGGPYILFIAFFKPDTFLKPDLAKRQGLVALLVGAVLLLLYFKPWQ
jgi:hypothetical protein